jgi:hypothetical protein
MAMGLVGGVEQVVIAIFDAVQHLGTRRDLEVMGAEPERSYMYCLELSLEKGIADVFL